MMNKVIIDETKEPQAVEVGDIILIENEPYIITKTSAEDEILYNACRLRTGYALCEGYVKMDDFICTLQAVHFIKIKSPTITIKGE